MIAYEYAKVVIYIYIYISNKKTIGSNLKWEWCFVGAHRTNFWERGREWVMRWTLSLKEPDFVVKKEHEFHLPLSEDTKNKSCNIVMLLFVW